MKPPVDQRYSEGLLTGVPMVYVRYPLVMTNIAMENGGSMVV